MFETPLLTVDCVVFDTDKVVLIRRGFEPFKNWYALPGGFVDIGESVEQACVRELKEETGLEIEINKLQLIGVYSDPSRDPRRHTVSVAFLGRSNLDTLQAGDDAISVHLVKDWRNKDMAFDHKKILEDAWYLNNYGIMEATNK
jgi:8-oxo-dGTP diphosphatase